MLNALNLYIKSYLKSAIVVIFFIAITSTYASAQGNLLITPKRVVFDGKARSHVINLANIGKDTARYAVSFIQIRMKDDGSFEQITQPDPGQNFSDKSLRIFPRTVTLGPNESQVIKIQVAQYEKLLPGEYRSHLYFRAITKEEPLGDTKKPDSSAVTVRLTPVFGISIPILIRSGISNTKVNLSNLKLETISGSQPILSARFNRSGNMSVYGDLTVEHVSNTGKTTRVGLVKGISVYTPNLLRDMKIKLEDNSKVNYNSGKLVVTYALSTDGKLDKLATAELLLH